MTRRSNPLIRKVEEFIRRSQKLNVMVVGETIVDEFVKVSYEGQSMKSFCPVFRLEGDKVSQKGGASAIAAHLKGFVSGVQLITNKDHEIVKTRYVDSGDNKKHVEINTFNLRKSEKPVTVNDQKFDTVIVADFGHGFCDDLRIKDGFHLMCQTNSNNFGFNRISKWKGYRKKSVCLDLREASLQMNRKISDPTDKDVKEIYGYEMNTDRLFITVGKKGSVYTEGSRVYRQPAYPSQIVDTIGAGDTFYAFSSLACSMQLDPADCLLIPSLAASLSTTWLCNEKSVTPDSLLEYAHRFI